MSPRKQLALAGLAAALLCAAPALAAPAPDASAVFADGPNGEKVHIASGFSCPVRVGRFIRDAVGERDVQSHTDFCSYYGFDGVYGTVLMRPAPAAYDAAASLAPLFEQEEAIGAKQVQQTALSFGAKTMPLFVFFRAYETSHLETLHYRIAFTGAVVSNWIIETATEYAGPRDTALERDFLGFAYGWKPARAETGAGK